MTLEEFKAECTRRWPLVRMIYATCEDDAGYIGTNAKTLIVSWDARRRTIEVAPITSGEHQYIPVALLSRTGAKCEQEPKGYADIFRREDAAKQAEEMCAAFDPPKPDHLADIIGRLDAHEERLDAICRQRLEDLADIRRQLAELRETMRQPVVASKDVAVGDAVYSPPTAAAAEAYAFVLSLQNLVGPVDVVSGPNQWTMTKNGRRVDISFRDGERSFRVSNAEPMAAAAAYLRGA